MNLRVWLIVGVLCGLAIPFSMAESRRPMEGISFIAQAGANTADEEIKGCDAGKEPDLRIAACTEIIRKNPGVTKKLGLAYFLRGNAYQAKQDYEHAIADYDESLRLAPGIAVVVKNRGVAYARKGDYDHSIEDLEQLLQLKDNDPQVSEVLVIVYNNRGLGYGKNSDYDRAIQDFSKALALNPDFTEAISNRGVYEAKKGDLDKAIDDLEHTLRLSPHDHRATDGLFVTYNTRAVKFAEKGDYGRAIEDSNKALGLRPDDPGVLTSRGAFELEQHDYDHALQDFDQALRQDPKQVGALLGRGAVHYKKYQFDEALKDYDEALRLDPSNQTVIDQRNKTLLVKGDLNRAPGAETEPKNSTPNLPFTVKNLVSFQPPFIAVKAGSSYKGYRWRGLYEINNQGDTNVTITDFQVLWQSASFEGQQLKLAARLKPTAFSIFDDLDAVIKSADEKEGEAAKKFPISVPPHSTRYVAIYFLFDLFSEEKQPLQFQDEEKAYRQLSAALGWKPNSDGNFNCQNDNITVAVSTAQSKGLKFESLTALLVPGCKVNVPRRSAFTPFTPALPGAAGPALGSSPGSKGPPSSLMLRNVVTKGLSVEEYTRVISQDPNNAEAYNERGKAYLSKREYDRAIQDFNQALRLRPYYGEAKDNLKEAERAKAKVACGFQLFCNP
ncbi:MAG TPA: tetratricopeptide repeat protein [Candidatus Angelobacter sp.]|nr:tetratricopeptide repeat protein [Candidatus Angelobacter sp.]